MTTCLGIEIGGTKLQLGVGDRQSRELAEIVRLEVDAAAGANGIVAAIEEQGRALLVKHDIASIGVGFGGPVDIKTGVVTKSHQIAGWDQFPLGDRLSKAFDGLQVRIDNDCNVAALGEARLGAGQGSSRVFYVTVGTGIGGGFVIDGRVDGNQRPAISEIGHMRPGIESRSIEQTVENAASGWGIERYARRLLDDKSISGKERLLELCSGDPNQLTGKSIGIAVAESDPLTLSVLDHATQHLGWAIAQVATLLAPEVVVIGGGVSLIGEPFFSRVREQVDQYVFSPLRDSFTVVPASLAEEVVVHGALLLAGVNKINA